VNVCKKRKKILLLGLLVLGLFLRLYRLPQLMTFLGDEGRDMLVVKDIVEFKNFPLVGPPTSVGQLFLGPIYYYFITPFALLFGMSPVGPAFFVVLLGAATIYLVYLTGKKFFNETVGLFSALFYTISPLTVEFSRSSWNPNPMPFFTLLTLLSVYLWREKRKEKFLYLAAVSASIMLQLHYLSILLVPFFVLLVVKLGKNWAGKKDYLGALAIVLLMISPLFIFDLRHNFYNFKGLMDIIGGRGEEGFSILDLLSRSRDRVRQLFGLFYLFKERGRINHLLSFFSMLILFWQWIKNKKQAKFVFFGYVFWSFLSLGFYRHSVYPHYMGFLFPVPALLIGNLIFLIFKKGIIGKTAGVFLVVFLTVNMAKETQAYLLRNPAINVEKVKKTVRLIGDESGGKPFNFSLLAENNYDSSYRYFFELWEIPVKYETIVTHQLFVVCEDDKVCKPEGNAKWEIAMFDSFYNGRIKKTGFWEIGEPIEIYKFEPKNK